MTEHKAELTERQCKLIAYCKSKGYGWEKFASNVETQGWCSEAQSTTLENMAVKLTKGPARKRKGGNGGKGKDHPNWDRDGDRSDYEAMSFGEYF